MPESQPATRFSDADGLLRAAMSGLAARQRTIAHNVANADTPNFKASEVRFEAALRDALAAQYGAGRASAGATRLDQAELRASVTRARPVEGTVVRADGNNVDIEREMVQLAETTLAYNALTQSMATRLGIMRNVISGGGR